MGIVVVYVVHGPGIDSRGILWCWCGVVVVSKRETIVLARDTEQSNLLAVGVHCLVM